jgi:Flp pilus assembly protein TadG
MTRPPSPTCGPQECKARAISRFAHDEGGALIIFTLMLFVLMVMMGGMAVDLMRYESTRTSLQQVSDRSVLAAASLRQALDREGVVRDYFAKEGLSGSLIDVDVDDASINFASVSVVAEAPIQPFFMHMLGIDNLNAPAASTAQERITDIEISLVLDISGSMEGDKIDNLKVAAKEFVDTVINSSDPGRVTVSIVPYNAQVNLGEPLEAQFNVAELHSNSYCVELPNSVFSSVSLSTGTSLVHNGHFDPYSDSTVRGANNMLFHCPTEAGNTVTPLSDNIVYLQGRIDALSEGGNTSIDLGMKWGSLLLHSSAQGVIDGLIARGVVAAAHTNRPMDPATNEVLKIVVLMTDGQNTTEYKLNPAYASGNSNVWRRNSDGRLSVYHNRNNTTSDYYSPDNNSWTTTPLGGTNGSTRQTWPQVWAQASVQYVAWNLHARPLGTGNNGFSNWYYTFLSTVWDTKNSRLQEICNAAKNSGIVVFGIGFEAPSDGRTQVRNCSTTPSHYFDADGLEISTAFRAIASQISSLRLTQ